MLKLLALCLPLLAATSAAAQFRPYGATTRDDSSDLSGLYAALGGGYGLLIASDDAGFVNGNSGGWDGEARLGYSFGVSTQIYLDAAIDSATFGPNTVTMKDLGVSLQYHIAGNRSVLAYTRFGLGVALSSPPANPNQTGAGLAGWGGIGLEIRVADTFFLAPELVYRNASVKVGGQSLGTNFIGIQLNLVYY